MGVVVDVAGFITRTRLDLCCACASRKSIGPQDFRNAAARVTAPLSVHATVGVFKGITFTFVLVKVFLCSFSS